MRNIEPSPERIVDNGRMKFGTFKTPVENPDFLSVKMPGLSRFGFIKKTRFKQWVGWGISHPEWYGCIFMLDAGITRAANFYSRNLVTGEKFKYSRISGKPFFEDAPDLIKGTYSCNKKGFNLGIESDLASGGHRIKVSCAPEKNAPALEADLFFHEDLSRLQPLVVSLPLRSGHSIYTHKAPCPASGAVKVGDTVITLDPKRDIAILDEHRSFLPYVTKWRWTTCAGFDSQGRLVAVNLGIHDTISDNEKWNENCIWVDGKISYLGVPDFEFNMKNPIEPWRIVERNGRADLTFTPVGVQPENNNFLIIKMRYSQPYGRFSGFVIDDDGNKHVFNDFFGVAEFMDARF